MNLLIPLLSKCSKSAFKRHLNVSLAENYSPTPTAPTRTIWLQPKCLVWLPVWDQPLPIWYASLISFYFLAGTLPFICLHFNKLREDKDQPGLASTHKVSHQRVPMGLQKRTGEAHCLALIRLFLCHGHVDQCVPSCLIDMWCSGSPILTKVLQSRIDVGRRRLTVLDHLYV